MVEWQAIQDKQLTKIILWDKVAFETLVTYINIHNHTENYNYTNTHTCMYFVMT